MPVLFVPRSGGGAGGGPGAGALVQSATASAAAHDATTTLPASPSSGDQRIIIGTCRNGGPRLSITSPASGFTALFAEVVAAGFQGECIAFRRTVVGGDSASVTLNSTGNDSATSFDLEINGVAAVTNAFTANVSVATISPAVTGTITPTSGGVFVVEAFFCDWGEPAVAGTLTKGTGWTQLYKYDGAGFGPKYIVQYGAFPYNAIPVSGIAASTATKFTATRIVLQ